MGLLFHLDSKVSSWISRLTSRGVNAFLKESCLEQVQNQLNKCNLSVTGIDTESDQAAGGGEFTYRIFIPWRKWQLNGGQLVMYLSLDETQLQFKAGVWRVSLHCINVSCCREILRDA